MIAGVLTERDVVKGASVLPPQLDLKNHVNLKSGEWIWEAGRLSCCFGVRIAQNGFIVWLEILGLLKF